MRILAVLIAFITACSSHAPPGGPMVLVDDGGDTVRLAHPALRVASLIPATTELLFALGADSQVVGRTKWCDWPPQAQQVTNLGDGIAPNVEAILGVHPDLVLLYRSARNAQAAERLRTLGIATLQLRIDTFQDFGRTMALLGYATGHDSGAAALQSQLDQALAAVDRRGRSAGPSVLILAWDQPPMTIGRGSFLHQLVEMAGGHNLFADVTTPDAPVSLEAIAARNPDLVLTTSESPGFAERPEWRVIAAVKARRFVTVKGSEYSRPSTRAPDAIRRLAAAFDSVAGH
jgi:iron complex transport system substrate-binding protein